MAYCDEVLDFEQILADERPRLVRLCAWFTRDGGPAEDLAQETLTAAWKNREQLSSPEKIKPWTSAIARNICLSWSRRARREQAHIPTSLDDPENSIEEEFPDELEIELELDRHELAVLLDRALSLLPPETGQMLIDHYIQESSHAEIAARLKIRPGTVAVRLQRGKLALQRYLRTSLKDEAQPFGLLPEQGADWEETNLWCLGCGQVRLLGRFQKGETFALRCPHCSPEPEAIMAGMDLTHPYYANLLGNLKTYKPAYTRLLTALAPLYRQALKSGTAACPSCGHAIRMSVDTIRKVHSNSAETNHIHLECTACGFTSNKSLSGLVMGLPEVQQFWREHPRLRLLPEQEIEVQGSGMFLTRIQSVTSAAEISVISERNTFSPIQVHTNIRT